MSVHDAAVDWLLPSFRTISMMFKPQLPHPPASLAYEHQQAGTRAITSTVASRRQRYSQTQAQAQQPMTQPKPIQAPPPSSVGKGINIVGQKKKKQAVEV